MNYRHAFHAGNFADVVKHAVMVWIIAYLHRKPAAIRIIDTHAGVGRYHLLAGEALRTGEWQHGIGRLLGPGSHPIEAELVDLLGPYLDGVRAEQRSGALEVYPGSPLQARRLLRADDRLQVNELQPDDANALRRLFARDPLVTVMSRDGYEVLRAALPPNERRGLVLIDPPFERADEFDRIETGLRQALERFRTGVYLVWYPVKDQRMVAHWLRAIQALLPGPALTAEIDVGAAPGAAGLARAGLLVINPPFGLAPLLRSSLPVLARRLAQGPGAHAQIADLHQTADDAKPR